MKSKSEQLKSPMLDAALTAEEQKQASQYARSLIEASLDPLVTISTEGKITDVNEATIKVTGVPATSSSVWTFQTISRSLIMPERATSKSSRRAPLLITR